MSTRANLARIQPGEQEQYLTVNSGFDATEKLLDSINVRSVAGGATVALGVVDVTCATLKLTGALTANIVVTMPSGFEAKLAVWNATSGAFSLTFKTAAGGSTGEVISQGAALEIVSDGTDIKYVGPASAGIQTQIANSGGSVAVDGTGKTTVMLPVDFKSGTNLLASIDTGGNTKSIRFRSSVFQAYGNGNTWVNYDETAQSITFGNGGVVNIVFPFGIFTVSKNVVGAHLGSTTNDKTQDAVRIQPSGAVLANRRALANYAATADTVPNLYLTTGGDVVLNDATKGVILKSPNGHFWRQTVSDTGVISTADLGTTLPV